MKALWYCSPCTNLGFDVPGLVDPSINRANRSLRCPWRTDRPTSYTASQYVSGDWRERLHANYSRIQSVSNRVRPEFNSRVEHTPLGLSKLFLSPCLNMMQKFAMFCIPSKSVPRLGHSAESEQHFHRAAIKAPALVFILDADQPHTEMRNRRIIASFEDLTAWLFNAFGVHRMLDTFPEAQRRLLRVFN